MNNLILSGSSILILIIAGMYVLYHSKNMDAQKAVLPLILIGLSIWLNSRKKGKQLSLKQWEDIETAVNNKPIKEVVKDVNSWLS